LPDALRNGGDTFENLLTEAHALRNELAPNWKKAVTA
jgi:hypothetical protein